MINSIRENDFDSVRSMVSDGNPIPPEMVDLACSLKHYKIAKYLVVSGATVDGNDSLCLSESIDNEDMVNFLVFNGANYRIRDIVHEMVERGYEKSVKKILRDGYYLEKTNSRGHPLLDVAIIAKNKRMIEILLKEGALVMNIRIAALTGDMDIFMLVSGARNWKKPPLDFAIAGKNLDMVKHIVEKYPECLENPGRILCRSCYSGTREIVEYFMGMFGCSDIEEAWPPEITYDGYRQLGTDTITLMEAGCMSKDEGIVDLLVERGITRCSLRAINFAIDRKDNKALDLMLRFHKPRRLLHWACFAGYHHCVRLLVDHAYQVNEAVNGKYPLEYAVDDRNECLCKILLELGADPDVGNCMNFLAARADLLKLL